MQTQLPAADDTIDALSLLKDPVRRSLFELVRQAPGDVSRDEAAAAAGVSRPLVAFHLDKLAEAGLLDVGFRRLTGRSGPGAGRPAKVYRRSERELGVSIPAREYELAAELLLQALEGPAATAPKRRLSAVAYQLGRSLVAPPSQRRPALAARLRILVDRLSALGFEPLTERRTVRLRNCPFHRLSAAHPELVCGMNLDLVRGLCDGLAPLPMSPRLEPGPDRCCVLLQDEHLLEGDP